MKHKPEEHHFITRPRIIMMQLCILLDDSDAWDDNAGKLVVVIRTCVEVR
jgi:hypothetical protein